MCTLNLTPQALTDTIDFLLRRRSKRRASVGGFDVGNTNVGGNGGIKDGADREDRAEEFDENLTRRLSEAMGNNALHLACLYYPSLETVQELVHTNSASVFELNSLGQTALHVAAARGASPQVINYLLEENPEAASMQDLLGRTPLHLACCSGSRACDSCNSENDLVKRSSSRVFVKGPTLAVIKALCKAAPSVVNVEDKFGMNPVECAIDYGDNIKLIRALHKASEREWKRTASSSIRSICRLSSALSFGDEEEEKELIYSQNRHRKSEAHLWCSLTECKAKESILQLQRTSLPRAV